MAHKQPCPICHCERSVTRDGHNNPRKIRHLSIFGRKSYVHVPSLRLACTRCRISYVWTYSFVGPKQRYSRAFRSQTVEQALVAPRQLIALECKECLPVRCSRCIKKHFQLKASAFPSKLGAKLKTPQAWYSGLMTLRSKKGIRTILASTIFGAK